MPDSAARSRALDTARSFIVQAPAGSGKTELLIQRYLKLLATVDEPDSVVAITFTRKAAAEMRARVVEGLSKAERGDPPESEHQRITFEIARKVIERDRGAGWRLTENPARMRIETIDALCASITRRMPWLARFGAMPEITEKAEDLYREAARNTLRHVERGFEPLAEILLHLDNNFYEAERLVAGMLAKRDQWLRHVGMPSVRGDLEASLRKSIGRRLRDLKGAIDYSAGDQPADLPQWIELSKLVLTKAGDLRQRVDQGLRSIQDSLRSNPEAREALRSIGTFPPPHITDAQWQTMEAAIAVMKLAVGELQVVFRERGRVDFAELSIRASEALGRVESPSDLALALGYRIRHILLDEFQDTSYSQFELLEKLTIGWEQGDGRTLFLVGDPMQSIYRFREADVSLMLRAREQGIGAIRFEPLALSVNFRSEPEIVEWVNEHFKEILPAKDDIDAGAVAYSRSSAGSKSRGEARIAVHAFAGASEEAEGVLELVKRADRGKTAILVRARSHLAEIVPLLKKNRIPFQAVEIDELGERAVVEDLMALTFALLHPADRVSWLAVLRAPWCGLTLADLLALAGMDREATIWDLLHEPGVALSADGGARVQRILPVLEHAIAERGRRPLRDQVESVWLRLGGPAALDETALEDAAAYFDLLEGLERGADLDDFGWFREQVNALFAHPDTRAGDALQLMTIHKAKGLEFDKVILPGLEERTRSEDPTLVLWVEQSGELLLAPIKEVGVEHEPLYDFVRRLARSKDEHETARLLYVAATRARSSLHLTGCVTLKADGGVSEPVRGSFLKLLWPRVAQEFGNVSRTAESEATEPPRIIRRVPAGWQTPAPPPAIAAPRQDLETLEPARVSYQWAGQGVRLAGTALHGFLQRIAREGLEAWDERAVKSRRDLYRNALANLGVAPLELEAGAARVEAGLVGALRDPRGRWILDAHAEAECEYSIAGLIDGRLVEAVIDRTFVDEQGVRWIIDYKTSEHEGGDMETFLENERARYQEQLERYARLLFGADQRPIRLGLYFPLLGGWREWAAPVVQRKQATQATLFEL